MTQGWESHERLLCIHTLTPVSHVWYWGEGRLNRKYQRMRSRVTSVKSLSLERMWKQQPFLCSACQIYCPVGRCGFETERERNHHTKAPGVILCILTSWCSGPNISPLFLFCHIYFGYCHEIKYILTTLCYFWSKNLLVFWWILPNPVNPKCNKSRPTRQSESKPTPEYKYPALFFLHLSLLLLIHPFTHTDECGAARWGADPLGSVSHNPTYSRVRDRTAGPTVCGQPEVISTLRKRTTAILVIDAFWMLFPRETAKSVSTEWTTAEEKIPAAQAHWEL